MDEDTEERVWPWDRDAVTQVVVENGITRLDGHIFENHQYLMEVTLPESITRIPDYAFSGCLNLKTMNFPSQLTYIGEYALSCCGFRQITLPASVKTLGDSAFNSNTLL